ncbi:MAG TPA: Glu/Leu/Phe/Val dehydrogenase dimerization domain-containing protein [Solirubrobacteraceae bacterium]|nr:Glu/Leu/Phe/Val dehydrogenase dimerization domain-containing protein [Solirubrobacteraceae bacterium]
MRRGPRSGLYTFVAVHSTARGPALGGCRMWAYDDASAAMRDAMRLSRAMTFKAAVADLKTGGGKGVIMMPGGRPISSERRHAALLDFADTVKALDGRYITAEDVGTSSRDMRVIAERTKHVVGLALAQGGSGDPSPFTALGVEIAIRACCERVFGSPDLRGRSVCVVGLGHVGSRVAKLCARGGAKLTVADLDESKRRLVDQLGARWVTPERALEAPLDVLAPCALGGFLDEESVPRLRCAIVAGAANNQLADDSVADLLAARAVLWAPDFVVNAGGLINVAEELTGYHPASVRRRVRGIADTLRTIFAHADAIGATPLTAAMELARRRLAAAQAQSG